MYLLDLVAEVGFVWGPLAEGNENVNNFICF